jgi:DNA modification methylase
LAGSKKGDYVIDPFFGSGTTGLVANLFKRHFIGIELNANYIELAKNRLASHDISFEIIEFSERNKQVA